MAKKEESPLKDVSKRLYERIYKNSKDKDTAKQISVEFYTWDEEGQILIGKLLSSEPVMSKEFGKEYNRYVFDTDEGLQGVICGTQVDTLVEEKDLIGQILVIEYQGRKQLEGGKTVNKFKVSVIS